MKPWILLCGGLAAGLPLVPGDSREAARIRTSSGTVEGHKASWPEGSNVDEFLGIPYAAPPVGNLRFMPPQPLTERWNSTVKADDFMDACMQPAAGADSIIAMADPAVVSFAVGMGGIPGRKYSEDCLGLNIWSKLESEKPLKPVLIWLYGGGFTLGDTAAPYYNGARMTEEQGVVVVTVGYRLNVFGFPGAPGLSDYNLGLLDQRAAVSWLRDNVQRFGGDPKRMTLFGQSAGGISVDAYSYAWVKDPIINGFIAQSGTVFLAQKQPKNNPTWFQVSKEAGCGGTDAGEKTLECMKKLPASAIMKAMGEGISSLATVITSFGLTTDEKVIFSNYPARAAAGLFVQRPFLSGTTDSEAGIASATVLAAARSAAQSPGIQSAPAGFLQGVLDTVRHSYFVAAVGGLISPFIDSSFNCPTREALNVRFRNKVPVWRYRFMATFPNTEIYPDTGAFHGIELPSVFGTSPRNVQKMADTSEQKKLTVDVMTAWATFARDPEHGLSGLGWPVYNPNSEFDFEKVVKTPLINVAKSLVKLGSNNEAAVTLANHLDYDATCDTITSISQLLPNV